MDLFLQDRRRIFPIAGMNTMTLDYLLAALYLETGQYDYASKMIEGDSGIQNGKQSYEGSCQRFKGSAG